MCRLVSARCLGVGRPAIGGPGMRRSPYRPRPSLTPEAHRDERVGYIHGVRTWTLPSQPPCPLNRKRTAISAWDIRGSALWTLSSSSHTAETLLSPPRSPSPSRPSLPRRRVPLSLAATPPALPRRRAPLSLAVALLSPSPSRPSLPHRRPSLSHHRAPLSPTLEPAPAKHLLLRTLAVLQGDLPTLQLLRNERRDVEGKLGEHHWVLLQEIRVPGKAGLRGGLSRVRTSRVTDAPPPPRTLLTRWGWGVGVWGHGDATSAPHHPHVLC